MHRNSTPVCLPCAAQKQTSCSGVCHTRQVVNFAMLVSSGELAYPITACLCLIMCTWVVFLASPISPKRHRAAAGKDAVRNEMLHAALNPAAQAAVVRPARPWSVLGPAVSCNPGLSDSFCRLPIACCRCTALRFSAMLLVPVLDLMPTGMLVYLLPCSTLSAWHLHNADAGCVLQHQHRAGVCRCEIGCTDSGRLGTLSAVISWHCL